jgi:hypothetical protein
VRCLSLHGLDVPLLLKLGKTYECLGLEAAACADGDTHASAFAGLMEERAATYYKVSWLAAKLVKEDFCYMLYFIQHCFVCRLVDSTVPEKSGFKPRTVVTLALTVRCSNHSSRSH